MENPTHRSSLDHQKRQTLPKLNDETGVEESYSSHTRVKLATIHSKNPPKNHEVSQNLQTFLGLANSLYSISRKKFIDFLIQFLCLM